MIIIKNNLTMKKFLILFVMLFAFTCVSYAGVGDVLTNSVDSVYHDGKAVADTLYHDGKAVVSTVYQDAKSGAVSIYPDVKSAVVSIGKAIGVAAEHVYGVLVKKYFVIGVKECCIMIGGFILFFIGLWNWRKYTKNIIVPSGGQGNGRSWPEAAPARNRSSGNVTANASYARFPLLGIRCRCQPLLAAITVKFPSATEYVTT